MLSSAHVNQKDIRKTMLQNQALNLLKMGKNIFLTGEAGSGKTYLLNQYIRHLKDNEVKVAVTASTGIAATHLNGSTIHSWSGIGIQDSLTDAELEKLATKDRVKRNYKNTRVLIIDEISMLHAHQLDMVDKIARRLLNADKPFGGLQVILCGDFFQLPPVNNQQQNTTFAFESSSWQNSDFHVCYLHEQHRQGNDLLYQVLNDIRSGTSGEHTKVPLRTRYKKEPAGETKATKLYCRNVNVDSINHCELAELPDPEKTFNMKTQGFHKLTDGLKKNCMALETLKLKIGAQVMFIKNDPLGDYSNGTRGVVTGFEKTREGWPIVKTYDNRILIAESTDWKYEENGVVQASISQVPLRLAWAITIHKSQGMTLDAAEIDLGDAFEPGMGYVALSRVRKLSGLKLMNLNEIALSVHPEVLKQDKIFKQDSEEAEIILQEISDKELDELHSQTLTKRFEAGKTSPIKRKSANTKTATHLVTLDLFLKNPSVQAVAAERDLTTSTVVSHLEKLVTLELIDQKKLAHLRPDIQEDEFELITKTLNTAEDNALSTVYYQLDKKYSYEDIRLVRLLNLGLVT